MPDDEPEDNTPSQTGKTPGKDSAVLGNNPPELNAESAAEVHGLIGTTRGIPEGQLSAAFQTPERRNQQKEVKTAADLAKMIELDLAHHPDCPKAGFRVTVYGWPHWQAMLTIEPAAGAVRNPQEWRELTQKLAERLRKRYELVWEK
jgi:hypothetical protein